MERKDYAGSLADEQPLAIGALTRERLPSTQLFIEHPWVDDHPITQHQIAVPGGYPRRDLVKLESGVAEDDRVTRIIAALEAHSPGRLRGQLVDSLPFTFVAPLGSEHDGRRHRSQWLCGGCMNPLVGR